MGWSIAISVVITVLAMSTLFLLRENRRLRDENNELTEKLKEATQRTIRRDKGEAYNKGLYDGRTSDTIYRKVLSRYSAGEQATVIMNGEAEK